MNDSISMITLKILEQMGYVNIIEFAENDVPIVEPTKKMEEEQPELYSAFMLWDNDMINSLWFKGFINVSMTDDGYAAVAMNYERISQGLDDLSISEVVKLKDLCMEARKVLDDEDEDEEYEDDDDGLSEIYDLLEEMNDDWDGD